MRMALIHHLLEVVILVFLMCDAHLVFRLDLPVRYLDLAARSDEMLRLDALIAEEARARCHANELFSGERVP